jgi:acyl-CoA synthetase (AMP-forming)/AMP-acid ligase II
MRDAPSNPSGIHGYHAHIYYAPETRPTAARVRARIGKPVSGSYRKLARRAGRTASCLDVSNRVRGDRVRGVGPVANA